MKKLMKTHKIFIAVILAVVVIIIAAISVLAYHNYKDQQGINSLGTKISSVDKKFTHTTDESGKFTILKSLENDFAKAKNSEKQLTIFDHFSILIHQDSLFNMFSLSISNRTNLKYQNEIIKLKKLIIGGYDTAIAKDTLTNVDTITDKSVLNTAETNLSTELKLITSEKDIVTTSAQLNAYTTKINALTTSYAARVKAIEDAEAKAAAEAKAKADAEAAAAEKAKQEAAAQKANNGKDSNQGGSNNGKNTSNDNGGLGKFIRKPYSNVDINIYENYTVTSKGVWIPNGWDKIIWYGDDNGNFYPNADVYQYYGNLIALDADGQSCGYYTVDWINGGWNDWNRVVAIINSLPKK